MKAIKARRIAAAAAMLLMLASCSPPLTATTDASDEAEPIAAATGEMCGGMAGIACAAASDYCAMPGGTCNIADGSGTCTARPEICTLPHNPVCGCDGVTYSNECLAQQAGVNVASVGACASPAATP